MTCKLSLGPRSKGEKENERLCEIETDKRSNELLCFDCMFVGKHDILYDGFSLSLFILLAVRKVARVIGPTLASHNLIVDGKRESRGVTRQGGRIFFSSVGLPLQTQHKQRRSKKTTNSALINRCAGVATRQLLGVINVGILGKRV